MIRLLLVDDDPDIRDIMRLDLEDDPAFDVDTCGTSTEALEKVKEKTYDAIVTDWRMPVMNGTELIRRLRSDGCRSFVVVYSGHNIGADIRSALENGADFYIHRGGDPDAEFSQLRQIIWKTVGSREPQRKTE
jgi:CheY-like chemotaxis protein